MFPDWPQVRRRLGPRITPVASSPWFRIAVAARRAFTRIAVFSHAGHTRLNLAFNASPDEAPYFADPDAPATIGYPREPRHWSRLIVSRWDAQHYIGTSVRGLSACPTSA